MPDTITLTGVVATSPRHVTTSEGLPITNFRLASTHRRYDRAAQRWVDAGTNWFTITAFRQLAENAAASIDKGQRVLVTGRLRVRDWESDERTGTTVEVEAEAIGHDLAWCTTAYTRTIASAPVQAGGGEAPAAEPVPASDSGRVAADPVPASAAVPF